jgi:hypothetical protein
MMQQSCGESDPDASQKVHENFPAVTKRSYRMEGERLCEITRYCPRPREPMLELSATQILSCSLRSLLIIRRLGVEPRPALNEIGDQRRQSGHALPIGPKSRQAISHSSKLLCGWKGEHERVV